MDKRIGAPHRLTGDRIRIRTATIADVDLIARLHCIVAREAYRDLMPPSVYELMDETYRRRQWIERLGSPMRGDATFLVEDDNDLLGFGRAGPHASLPRGEVKTLYVATNHHGHGIGHLLMSTMARHLTELGHSRCSVEVVDGNLRAIRFYERLGGSFIGDVVNPGPHWKSRGLIYAWHDLSVFDAIPMPSPVPNPRSGTGTAGGRGSA